MIWALLSVAAAAYVAMGVVSMGFARSREPGLDGVTSFAFLAFWPTVLLATALVEVAAWLYGAGRWLGGGR